MFVRSVGIVLILLLTCAAGARQVEAQAGVGEPGQQAAVRFKRLSMADGLSSSSVTSRATLSRSDIGRPAICSRISSRHPSQSIE